MLCYTLSMKIIDKTVTIDLMENQTSEDRRKLLQGAKKNFDFYFKNLSFAAFDIETTGLSPTTSQVVLAGFAIPLSDDEIRIIQFFAENIDEEKDVLIHVQELIKSLDLVVTFNGASFDIPFVSKRCSLYNISVEKDIYNLDIYKIIKNFSDLGKMLPNLKQKTVENFLGLSFQRKDEISGKESIDLYLNYMLNPSETLLETILLHNSDDIKQLYRIVFSMYPVNLHRAMCINGFPLGKVIVPQLLEEETSRIIIDKMNLSKTALHITGKLSQFPLRFQEYCDTDGICYDFGKESFTVKVNLVNRQNTVFLPLNLLWKEDKENILKEATETGFLMGEYLIISRDKSVNHMAVTWLAKKTIERVIDQWI